MNRYKYNTYVTYTCVRASPTPQQATTSNLGQV
jgi:hypothetical protein